MQPGCQYNRNRKNEHGSSDNPTEERTVGPNLLDNDHSDKNEHIDDIHHVESKSTAPSGPSSSRSGTRRDAPQPYIPGAAGKTRNADRPMPSMQMLGLDETRVPSLRWVWQDGAGCGCPSLMMLLSVSHRQSMTPSPLQSPRIQRQSRPCRPIHPLQSM
jgi:hypothetical protein